MTMTNESIQRKLTTILKNMGIAEKAITHNASFNKDLGLDSLDLAELIMELETVFGINIPVLEAERLSTVQEAISYINKTTTN